MAEAEMSKDEKVGYHKGALNTLIAERNEFVRLVGVTEQLMQAHLKELGALGVKISSEDKREKK